MKLTWLRSQPKPDSKPQRNPGGHAYLCTGGLEIDAQGANQGLPDVHLKAGERLALVGGDAYRKHYFCDWILGFVKPEGTRVRLSEASGGPLASLLGRSPLLYGETIQEALLYRTQTVRKEDLYSLVERFYGPGLKSRTSPLCPLVDRQGLPVPTRELTAREHLEVAQINILLQKTPLVILDLSSELMLEAIAQGFRPAAPLFESGKTVIALLPPDRDLAWAEQITGQSFTTELRFE